MYSYTINHLFKLIKNNKDINYQPNYCYNMPVITHRFLSTTCKKGYDIMEK